MKPTLDCEIADGVAMLTMNRPEARNALDSAMKEAFAEAVPRVAADASVRAVVLTGANGAFCAGGDLRGMEAVRDQMTIESWRDRMREVHPWLEQLIGMDKAVIAAVDGPAFGAGFSLALCADFVLASERARFCLSFMRMGLVPDFAAMYSLPRVVGVQRAKELMLSAREVNADEALRLGIAMEVLPAAELLPRARLLARSFVHASPMAVGLIKQSVGLALASDLSTVLDQEAAHQALCFSTEAHRAAVQRFVAKQPTLFSFPPPQR